MEFDVFTDTLNGKVFTPRLVREPIRSSPYANLIDKVFSRRVHFLTRRNTVLETVLIILAQSPRNRVYSAWVHPIQTPC